MRNIFGWGISFLADSELGVVSGELGFSGIVYVSLGVEGRGTPVADSGGWGWWGGGGENFTYAIPSGIT